MRHLLAVLIASSVLAPATPVSRAAVRAPSAHVQSVATDETDPNSPKTINFAGNTTNGNAVIVCVSWNEAGGVNVADVVPTLTGATFTTIQVESFASDTRAVAMFMARNITGGQTAVTVTTDASATEQGFVATEISGLAATNGDDEQTSAENAGTSPSSSGNLTATGVANGILVGCYAANAPSPPNGQPAAGLGFTEREESLWEFYTNITTLNVTATGTYSCENTFTGSVSWGQICAFFADADQGGAATSPLPATIRPRGGGGQRAR